MSKQKLSWTINFFQKTENFQYSPYLIIVQEGLEEHRTG
jgi:hypothetical protein